MEINHEDNNDTLLSCQHYLNRVPEHCPHCYSLKFIKYGRYKNIPRYKCGGCGRTFSIRTFTPWYYSKKSDDYWECFYRLLHKSETLDSCAKSLKINIATAFFWRHKILNSIKKVTDVVCLSNQFYMMNYLIKESFKGNKIPINYNRENIWVAMSSDSQKNILSLPYCRKFWNKVKFVEKIYTKVDRQSIFLTSGNNYLNNFAKNHNKIHKQLKKIEVRDHIERGETLKFLSSYRKLMIKTKGIATKYLNHYFALSKLLKSSDLMKVPAGCRCIDFTLLDTYKDKNPSTSINGSYGEVLDSICNMKGYIKCCSISRVQCL